MLYTGCMAYLTIQDIREELQDRTPGDNTIDCDLAFSDDEIRHAMKRAAAAYNSVPPLGIDRISWNCLPADTTVFMEAVISQLYKAQIHRLARNQMQWQTGDTTVNFESTRMQSYQQLQQQADQAWKEAARERKMAINRAIVWGSF